MLLAIIALFATDLVVSAAISRWPLAFARFARIPVGKRMTLPLPARVSALVLPIRAEKATYRAAPERAFDLAALPGAESAQRDLSALLFVPRSSAVLARPRGWTSRLVRVQVSAAPDHLVLQARRFPSETV